MKNNQFSFSSGAQRADRLLIVAAVLSLVAITVGKTSISFILLYSAAVILFCRSDSPLHVLVVTLFSSVIYISCNPFLKNDALVHDRYLTTVIFFSCGLATGFYLIGRRERAKRRALERSAIKQKAILDNQLVGVATIKDRKITWSNPVLEQLLGYEPNGLQGLPTRHVYPSEESYEEAGERAYRILKEGGVFRSEVRMAKRDGSDVWVDLAGRLLENAGGESLWLFNEITAQKTASEEIKAEIARTQDALRLVSESEDRYRLLAHNATDVIATYGMDGIFTYLSPAITALLGFEPAELIGLKTYEIIHPDDHARVTGEFRRLLKSGATSSRIEYRAVHKTGELIWVEAHPSPMLDRQGQLKGFQDVVRDVSARREAQNAARKSAERLEEALVAARDSEARYRHLAENANDMIATMAPDSTVLFVTPAVRRILGYEPEEVVGQKTLKLTHPDDVAVAIDVFQRLIKGGPGGLKQQYEFRALHKDGSWIWLEGQPRIEFSSSGHPLFFQDVVRDISARKATEETLRTSQAFLTRTSQIAGVGGWEYNVETGEVLWSDQTCRLHDVSIGHRPSLEEALSFYEPQARVIMAAAVQKGLLNGDSWDLELPLVSKEGRRFLARAVGEVEFENGRPVRMIGAFQDITESRRMSQDLAKSHQLLKITLDSIGDAVITTDAVGCVTWINPVAEQLTGWRNADAIGSPIDDIINAVDEKTFAPLSLDFSSDAPERQASHMHFTPLDGARMDIETTASKLRDEGGRLLGHVVAFRNVTEQRRLHRDTTYRATHDPLTGLTNRAEFEARLDVLISRRDACYEPRAILFVDLDHFKQVNDSCGHAQGDKLLCEISQLLKSSIRSGNTDSVARLGGDEFGIILENCTLEQANRVGQTICDKMERFLFTNRGRSFRIGTSIGVVGIDVSWISTSALLHAADMACYAAKHAGRNRVVVWNAEIEQTSPGGQIVPV